jgi:FMN reductase
VSILVISCSLDANSKSRLLTQRAFDHLQKTKEISSHFLDLAKLPLPFCDAGSAYSDANVHKALQQISEAKGILLGVPIYNYDVNAVLKNLIELTGKAWEGKVVGFFCAAGGDSSYMSVMSLANSLMLDFRCLIVPRFVYATGKSFKDNLLADSEVEKRVVQLTDEAVRITKALHT